MKNHILFVDGMPHLLVYLEYVKLCILRHKAKDVNESRVFYGCQSEISMNTYKIQLFFPLFVGQIG
ncbi:MAG: hypothetical protein D3910_11670 [Candidatus Electrothrix sp. ATG2]|nr:hypothetical protein [Candidatus Electrothrix sp. ATG2]